jgi:hypothetical protein
VGELSPEIIAALRRDLARCDEDRRTIAAATGRDEADSEWCAVIRLDRFRLALAALERIPELSTIEELRQQVRRISALAAKARDERDRWRLRAERLEVAAREVVDSFDLETIDAAALKALRSALAAAPVPGEVKGDG